MYIKEVYKEFTLLSEYTKSIGLLLARLIVAYGFYEPAMMKWSNISSVAEWFSAMGIPFATLSAYLAASAEITGVVFLTLGLFTRLVSLPLMVVMLVAIFTVHINNGFSAGNNGFEIPLYYFLFLLIFFANGAGKFSFDRLIFSQKN